MKTLHPLSHLKVLDFSTLLPGPFATMMLADFGADVIHIESPSRPDLVRTLFSKNGEDSVVHTYLNRSKKSLALDLKQPESIEAIKKLVMEYDVVIEQFRPGVMERLGIGYEDLKAINPKVIYCSITGYGQTGPYKNRPGHDNNFVSLSGISSYTGTKANGPIPAGFQIADVAGGSLHSIIGILLAVMQREKINEGQWLDISMTDCAFSLNSFAGPAALMGNVTFGAEEFLLNGGGFYGYYETKDGKYFSVGSMEPPFRKLLCEAIGQPELITVSMSEREEDVRIFKEALQQAFLTKTFDEWQVIFNRVEACVEPVLTVKEASMHPQLVARNMVVDVPSDNGNEKQIANPIKSTAFTAIYKHSGVKLGEHNREILEKLGMNDTTC